MIIGSGRSRTRSAVVVLAAAALAVTGTVTVVARTTTAAAGVLAAAAPVEDEGADCAVPDPGSLTANAKLPDPFKKINGTRITTRSDWRCRRAEIKDLAERYVYGRKPRKPATVTGTVSATNITVNVTDQGRSSSFSTRVELPSGTGPFPAVVVLGGLGADTATIKAAGAAVISYDPLSVGKEGTPRNNKQGAFYSIYGATSSTGLLMAWAWGVSRIIDVIEQSGGNILKADATGVTGCSRYGKGTFVTGAFDQRIALTMPIESGSGGAPIFRGTPGESGSQPLSSAYGEQPWLGDAFNSFTGNPNTLPVDTHEMVAMVAPRGLLIMENPHIDWLAARSGSVAALGGAEVYKALGAGDNITYWSDIQDGTHCAVRSEWRDPLQKFIKKFLTRTGNDPGTIRIASKKAGNLADWRDWQTPTLSDGGPTTPPPTTAPPTTTPPTTAPPTTAPPTTNPPTGGCSASVTNNQWVGGFTTTVRVTAGSSPVNGWTVGVTLPSGSSVTNTWNATASGSTGTVQFTNVSYNGSIAPGQSTEFGFQGTGTAPGQTPTCTAR
ncbi:cellulose-binding domain-containing protein [Micromonospora narathiwatensis]|uniref:Cellulose binding domain-containing protein n=1 Tax=Micromonospora narathiwatensis TaxID=299146 RepID=A0A1A8ZPW3_9ACTN|nr:cellulose-binding domain-containing protein [Micromonospora narathiwatensis]SBT46148.1 Cellulose binding domain-containing protein [Micromonospora narathiwatensis]